MIKFEKQQTPEHKYVVATNTICDGNVADKNEAGDVILYTAEEAMEEVQEMKDLCGDDSYFIEHMDIYVENRKVIYGNNGGVITGDSPIKQ